MQSANIQNAPGCSLSGNSSGLNSINHSPFHSVFTADSFASEVAERAAILADRVSGLLPKSPEKQEADKPNTGGIAHAVGGAGSRINGNLSRINDSLQRIFDVLP